MIAGAGVVRRGDGTLDRPGVPRPPLKPLPWGTVALLAVLLAYADGFWLISVQNAVGAIERTPEPFADWLRWSTPMVPVYGAAVLGALVLARWGRGAVSASRRLLRGSVLVVAAATLVGMLALAASAVYDYRLQSQRMEAVAAAHDALLGHVHIGGVCDALCVDKRSTMLVNTKAVGLGGLAELGTNAVLVAWVVALRGGRLDRRPEPAVPPTG